ncbi:hypothetical protein BA919_00985, partial [Helicobacter pullorum]|uniref:filamentous hemagglutinin N-terminal domain-containing protein n=1 Tax=Helicobacter pullorum TaxID=35818 RepID=UPI0008169790
WGGGANKPLTNSLKTKNSKPQKLTKNPKKIQDSIQLDSKIQESKKDSKTISKIGISIIASVLLSQNLAALPAGGKFIHGSGNIKVDGKTMTIKGNNKNHVIAWGGGFNINSGERVNFNGSGKSFLNLDYSNKASKIRGALNGGSNNIYLVNPSGVLIGQGASVNANRFVASTSSLDKALTQFVDAAKKNGDQNVATFSPVFKPNEVRGNIVNMGNITAGDIILVGKEVRNRTYVSGGDRNGVLGNFNHTGSLKIVGNKIFLDAEGVTKKNDIELMGFHGVGVDNIADIKVQMTMDIFKNKTYTDNWIKQTYTNNGAGTITNMGSIYNIITIGATNGWNNFATAWNSNLGITRNIEEFKLIKDINFGNGAFTSVGKVAGFNRIFNGNGYTMYDIKLTNSNVSSESGTDIVGIFNKIGGGTIKDLTINGVSTENIPLVDTLHLGAFAGQINGGKIENVTLNNINLSGAIDNVGYMGGFAGVINSRNGDINIKKVSLNNIENLLLYSNRFTGSNMYMGGFAGKIENASSGKTTIDGLILNKIGTLQTAVATGFGSSSNTAIGGFTTELGAGNSIKNVYLYFTQDSKFMPAAALRDNKDSRNQVSTFYHSMTGNNILENINVVYNTMITDPKGYGSVEDPGFNLDRATGFIYYTAKGMIDGIKQVVDGDAIKYGNRVKFRSYMNTANDQFFKTTVGNRQGLKVTNYNYSWVTSSNISGTYDMSVGRNTSSDYQTLIDKYLPQIIDDILEADYGVTIENENGTSTQATLNNIITQLNNILNAIKNKENEKDADGKITKFLNNILIDKDNPQLKESIKQSINFLRAFYDGYDNGSKQKAVTQEYKSLFSSGNEDYKNAYNNATGEYNETIKGGMTSLKNTISGKLEDIRKLEDTLKLFKEALKNAEVLKEQGAQLNTQVGNIKKQVEALDGEIANLEKAIAGLGGMVSQDKLQAMKAQLAAKKQERSNLKTQVANIIADIEKLKDTDLANLIKEVDGYVTTINDIRNGFIRDLDIGNPQPIKVMAGGANGSFTYYGVDALAQNNITDNIIVPSGIDSTPPKPPVVPTPDPNPDPITPPGGGDGGDGTDPDPDPITPPEGGGGGTDPDPDPTDPTNPPGGGDGGDGTDPTNPTNPTDPDNGGNNGGGDNGNNGGDNGDNSYEGDDTVNNESGYDPRLAYLSYRREVLKLPAEEETSIEINEGREKGRLCIVSDNAKTNTPCMAITY